MHGAITEALAVEEIPSTIEEAYRLASHSDIGKAEIVADAVPQWLVVTAVTGQEKAATAHLIARRFAIFLPEIDVQKGRERRVELMFAGHVFVFTWDTDKHWRRIKACPGVIDIIGTLPDSEIRRLQALENERRPLQGVQLRRTRRGYRKRSYVDFETPGDEVVAVRTWSALTDGVGSLDSEGRNELLRHALSPPVLP